MKLQTKNDILRQRGGFVCAIRRLLVVLPVLVVAGCRDTTSAPADPALLSSDLQVLRTLDHYDPIFKLDADVHVTHLKLPWRHLPAPVLTEINKLTQLQQLDLYGATVTDEGLAQLRDLQQLRNLGLGATLITDQGLLHLQKLQGLQQLWLPKNRVTEEGVGKLKSALPELNVHLQ